MSDFLPHRDKVFVTDIERGAVKTAGGVILPDDDMTERGIRSRWAKVWKVGSAVTDLSPGDWILVEHGRWSHKLDIDTPEGPLAVWHIEHPKSTLVKASEDPRVNKTFIFTRL